jgi:hypothetical protein
MKERVIDVVYLLTVEHPVVPPMVTRAFSSRRKADEAAARYLLEMLEYCEFDIGDEKPTAENWPEWWERWEDELQDRAEGTCKCWLDELKLE